TDHSWEEIQRLSGENALIRGVRFRRNFGKAAALAAGFEHAHGEMFITMDADLQDDPQELPRFVTEIENGLDCVSGWKKVRHDPWHKVYPSRVFNWLVGWLTKVKLHDHNCGFKAYRREVFNEVKLYGEMHRFVPVLAASRGYRVGEIVVQHHARQHGVSKYGVKRILKGFLDLLSVYFLTSFNQRPLHLIGSLGVFFMFGGGGGLFVLTVLRIVTWLDDNPENNIHLTELATFYYSILAILLGAQFLVGGLIAELITALHRPEQQPYSIAALHPEED
ncbi:MAG: glycosyltransferase family 2 protein, partial [Planctomycetota bacterium]